MKMIQISKAQFHKCVLGKASKLFYLKLLIGTILLFLILDYYFGISIKIKERDYYTEFDFPTFGDIKPLIRDIKQGEIPTSTTFLNHNYTFSITNQESCNSAKEHQKNTIMKRQNIDVVIFVKSAVQNFHRRRAIRNTWGGKARLKDVRIKTFFTLGTSHDVDIQNKVEEEDNKFRDLIQGDFTEAYFNNTIKTLMSFQWAYTFCDNSKFYFFVDDDYYVSIKNLLLFLKNPSKYEEYAMIENHETRNAYKNDIIRQTDLYSSEKDLYAGFVCFVPPVRDKSSKFFITFEEYQYNMFPPFINAGAYVISNKTMKKLFLASHFVKLFRFDDVYMGILVKKCGITPFHSKRFWRFREDRSIEDLNFTIASHEFHNTKELEDIWLQQVKFGNA